MMRIALLSALFAEGTLAMPLQKRRPLSSPAMHPNCAMSHAASCESGVNTIMLQTIRAFAPKIVNLNPAFRFRLALLLALTLAQCSTSALAQYDRNHDDGRGAFYNGARNGGQGGSYDGRGHDDDRNYDRHGYDDDRNRNSGGIGPGKGAAIGGAGGAALGAVFGGGLKGAIIGGAAGAGVGAIAGKVHQNNDRQDLYYRGRRY